MKVSGARMLLESLLKEGVDTVFGYPGGAVIPLYDALLDYPLRHILVRHEQAAAHAADAYARTTGKVGVCFATSGPGGTNLVTGLATAYMDSSPVVAFTGQVAIPLLGRDSFQESDLTGITIPITKHNYLVRSPRDIPRIVREAFHIASTGRPGPVLIDVPRDVFTGLGEPRYPKSVKLPGYKPCVEGHPAQIERAAQVINSSRKPVILAGGGTIISRAWDNLRNLAEKANIPVANTLMGLGSFPRSHPLSLGMAGMHGTYQANKAIQEADVLIALGTRFSDRTTGNVDSFAPNARIIHIDIDTAEIGKNVRVDVPIVGDLRNVLSALVPLVEPADHSDWVGYLTELGRSYPVKDTPSKGYIAPQYAIREIHRITGGRGILVTDVGQHQMWAALCYMFQHPRRFVTSGGLGTMGFGLPAAIGAQVGNPHDLVILMAGDGSIQMNIQELATISTQKLPIKIFIFNNGYLGMVRQWQDLLYNKRYSSVNISGVPDFCALAGAYGIKALRVTEPDQVTACFEEAISLDGPIVVDVHIDPEANVFPMVPPGQTLDNMILSNGG